MRDKFIKERSIFVGGKVLQLPCFFPSISTIKTNLSLPEYLRLIIALEYPLLLISAYDIYNSDTAQLEKIKELLQVAIQKEKVVLLDSGNYESFWKNDKDWDVEKYRSTLGIVKHQLAFCYDRQKVNKNVDEIAEHIEKQVIQDQLCSTGTIVPIIHAPKELLPKAISKLVDKLNPIFIAVPERELGDGIVNRVETISKIQKVLNQKEQYYPLHLLGCGNPLSILIYSICGANSFDGLEWCQTTVDHNTALLYHFHQREFFGEQTKFCTIPNFPYTQSTLAHNLQFYSKWLSKIQKELLSNHIMEMIERYIPTPAITLLRKRMAEVFNDR